MNAYPVGEYLEIHFVGGFPPGSLTHFPESWGLLEIRQIYKPLDEFKEKGYETLYRVAGVKDRVGYDSLSQKERDEAVRKAYVIWQEQREQLYEAIEALGGLEVKASSRSKAQGQQVSDMESRDR